MVSLAVGITANAEPILTSWFTPNSSIYARVIQTTTNSTGTHNTNVVTTWPTAGINNGNSGGLAQTLPAYADVQRIRYDAANVYINSSGLASYTMGPWLTSGGGLFGFWPVSQNFTVKFPRTPATPVPASKTRHRRAADPCPHALPGPGPGRTRPGQVSPGPGPGGGGS